MENIKFELKKEHLLLIQEMNISYDSRSEFGALIVDPKRPYGNSDVYYDIADILGINSDKDDEFTDEQIETMQQLHQETETALQIVLQCRKYMRDWKKIT